LAGCADPTRLQRVRNLSDADFGPLAIGGLGKCFPTYLMMRTRLTVFIDVRRYLYVSVTAHASRSLSSTGTLTPKGQLLLIGGFVELENLWVKVQ